MRASLHFRVIYSSSRRCCPISMFSASRSKRFPATERVAETKPFKVSELGRTMQIEMQDPDRLRASLRSRVSASPVSLFLLFLLPFGVLCWNSWEWCFVTERRCSVTVPSACFLSVWIGVSAAGRAERATSAHTERGERQRREETKHKKFMGCKRCLCNC
jgi:hypothetical protein